MPTALEDVAQDMGQQLGKLLPWIEPAIRVLSGERFDVETRGRVLASTGRVFAEVYADYSEAFLNEDAEDWLQEADMHLARFVISKARELHLRSNG